MAFVDHVAVLKYRLRRAAAAPTAIGSRRVRRTAPARDPRPCRSTPRRWSRRCRTPASPATPRPRRRARANRSLRWMRFSGVSRGTITSGRRSFNCTSAARSIKFEANPAAMPECAHRTRHDRHAMERHRTTWRTRRRCHTTCCTQLACSPSRCANSPRVGSRSKPSSSCAARARGPRTRSVSMLAPAAAARSTKRTPYAVPRHP